MMVQKSKKKNLFIIVSLIVIAIGVFCFVLAYGLSQGWDVLFAWFGSKWAVMLYILLGCYILLVLWLLIGDKIKEMR